MRSVAQTMLGLIAVAALAIPTVLGGTPPTKNALPQFERVVLLEESSETSANVSIGDLNDDGSLDIVLVKGRHWPLLSRVLLNDGHGGFPIAHEIDDTARRSYSAKLVDIDGDKDLDAVLSNDQPDRKLVLLNDGKGHFNAGSAYGDPNWPTRNAEVADLNGDALPDIVVANRSTGKSGANFVCLNPGHGKFDADCIAFSKEPATTIAAADFNRDGAIDLAVPFRDGGQSYVYLNDGHAAFQRRLAFGPPDAHFRVAAVADMNGDGRFDIVVIDEQRGAFVFIATDTGFAPGSSIGSPTAAPYALALSDLNKDGRADIVVGHVGARSIVYFNDGSGRSFAPVSFGDDKGTVYGFAIADLDKDGVLDIAAARSEAPNVVYFGSSSSR